MKSHKGFTFIEAVLVLGIAGLIFLMVFIALPGVWRSARDSERRDDVLTFVRKLKDYQTNNSRGALPIGPSAGTPITVNKLAIEHAQTEGQHNTWAGFYYDFFFPDGNVDNPTFTDPLNDDPYTLFIQNCDATGALGSRCNTGINKEDGELYQNFNGSATNDDDWTLYITVGAVCDDEFAVSSANPRRVSVQYKLEGPTVYCANT